MVQKELRKLSQWFWKEFLKWYDGGGENEIKSKGVFWSWSVFLLSKYWLPLLFEETLGAFFFFMLRLLRTWGFDDIWGENHFFKNFFSNGFNILAVDTYSEIKLYTPTWLNHDYGDGGVVDILTINGGCIFWSGGMHANIYGWG
jgi:hypothetical protein